MDIRHTFLTIYCLMPIIWLIKLKFYMKTQETIIYQLMIRNRGYGTYLKKMNFWALERAWPHPSPLTSRPDQKVSPWHGDCGQLIISKSCFQKNRAESPLNNIILSGPI